MTWTLEQVRAAFRESNRNPVAVKINGIMGGVCCPDPGLTYILERPEPEIDFESRPVGARIVEGFELRRLK